MGHGCRRGTRPRILDAGVTRRAARLVVDALRLDLWTREEVERRAARGLELGVGGFILFGGDADVVSSLTDRLGRDAGRPLWIGADLERGAGQQFRGLSELPPPAALARVDDAEDAARTAGRVTGEEAASVGVNWVLAPVLDLDAERRNPIVATRSFGADPAQVARLGGAWIEGCQSAGVSACMKHVPGHGRTADDSHIGLPVVAAGRDVLEADLLPFRRLAQTAATAMVAHVAYPALGAEGPATTEPSIVTGLLRDELGFTGPVATDAMIMGAIEEDAAAAVAAVAAGCDLVLYPNDAARTIAALDAASSERASAAIETALHRTEAALAALAGRVPSGGAAGPTRALTPDRETDFAVRAISGDPAAFAGWSAETSTRVVDVSDDPEVGPPAGREGPLAAILRDALADAGWRLDGAAEQTVVVLAATPRGWKGHVGLSADARERVERVRATSPRSAVVLLGHVRDGVSLEPPVVCAWSTESVMERAAARWLDRAVRGHGG